MKAKNIFLQLNILILLLAPIVLNAQEDKSKKIKQKEKKEEIDSVPSNIETTVITLDLSKPHINSLTHSMNKKRLVVKNNSPLSFVLINGNPFRFRYVLNYNKINLFQNVEFDPKPEDITDKSEEIVSPPSIDGQADVDGDGVEDDKDQCPDEPGYKYTDGCPKDLEEIKKDVIDAYGALETFFSEMTNNIELYRETISTQEILDQEEFNNKVDGFKKQYKHLLNSRAKFNELFSDLDLSDEEINSKIGKLDEAQEAARRAVESLIIKDSVTYLHPIDLFGDNIDYVEILLEIYDGNNPTPKRYPYKIWLRGGLKIDISGGIMVTSVLDNQYFTTDAENGEKFINENDNGGYEFGFGSMVNINFRSGSWFKPAINVGAIFTSNQKFQLLTGMGLILGKNERFIFHTGLAMGRINELRSDLVADGTTSFDLGTDGNIPVVEKFKFGHYFGVTYNFTKAKAKLPSSNE